MSVANLKEEVVEFHEDVSTENNSEFVTYQYITLPVQVLNDNSLNQFIPSGYILKTLENGALVLEENSVFNDESSTLIQINSGTKSTTHGTNESNVPLLIQDVKQPGLEASTMNEPFQLRTNISKNDSNCGIDNEQIIQENSFTCELCNKSFEKKIHLKKHKTQHLNDKPHKCTECAASFNILSNLNLHKIIHQKNVLKCPECGKTFTRSASLKAHLIVHEKEETINCPSCEDPFDTQLLLKEHINSCHKIKQDNEVQTPQKCKICYKNFDDYLSYKSHLRDHNKVRRILTKFKYPFRSSGRKTNVKLKHECSVCKKAFQKHSQLIRHIRIHTGERPFKCNLCNLAFSQNNTLKIHMTKHTGIRPHSCSLCPAKFSQRGNLRNHILRVHSIENNENIYECNECSCKFRKLGTLNAHMNRMHCNKEDTNNAAEPDMKVLFKELNSLNENCQNDAASESSSKKNTKNETNYWALKNEKSYATYRITVLADKSVDGTVRRHVIRQRKVGNIRWHQCSFCPKEFKKPSDVVRHIRIHTREKPFKCIYCNRCFTVQSTLTSHLRTHQSSNNTAGNGASFKCDICDKFFPNVLCWSNHNKKNHQVICQICNKSYRTQEQLAIHSQSHSLSEECKCTICDKIFPTPEQLSLHSRCHKKKKKDDEALYESVSLQEPIVLTQEGYIQAPVSSKNRPLVEANSHFRPHKCVYCGAAFRKSSHLKQHLNIHSTEKPFACTKCDSVFRYAHAAKNHMRTHDDSNKSFVCEQCNSCFTTSGSLRRHHRAQHSTARPYMCPYCQKTFKLSTSCRKHIKIHRSEIYRKQQDSMTESNVLDITVTAEQTTENITEIEADKNMNLIEENTNCNNPIINIPFETTEEVTATTDPEPISSGTIISDQLIQTLFTNKNVLADMNTNARQDDIAIEDSLNQQLYNIVGSDGVVDATINEKEGTVSEEVTLNTLQNDNNLPTQSETYLPILDTENPPYTVIFDLNNPIVINVANVLDQFKTKTPDEIQNTVQDIQDFQNIDENNIILTTNMNNVLPSQLSTPDKIDTQAMPAENKNGASNKTQFTKRKSKLIRSQKCKPKYKSSAFVKMRNHHSVNLKADEPKANELENETINELTTKKNKCNVCPKSFRKPSDLERHIRTHTGEKPFQCVTCQKRFSLNSTLKSHLKVHLGEKNFLCQVCNSLFSTKGSLNVHMRLHTGVKPFKCQFCDRHFRTSGHRQAHHQSHLKQAKRTNSKPNSEISRGIKLRSLFSESVASISDLRKTENVSETVIDKSTEKENIEKCSNLSKTEKMDNSENISNVCYMMDDKVSSIVDTNQHTEISSEILEHLQNTDNQTLIEDNALTLNNQAWYDIQTDENGQIVNIQPTINPSLFSDTLDLQMSARTLLTTSAVDSDIDPLCTTIVDAEFIEDSDNQAANLKTINSYDCLKCNKSFNKPSKLQRHFRIHTGERPFTCEYCNKTFNQTNALNMHLRTHSGNKPHQCPYCSHTSTQKGNMKTHLLRTHNVTTLPKQLLNPLNTSIVIQSNDGTEAVLKLEGDWNAS